ncbi:MAG: hypothetical protein IPG45_29060 [Deltaproteobacteria bacterium]|nr:hypothetical protein [Deltaproteobacteria bacterium]
MDVDFSELQEELKDKLNLECEVSTFEGEMDGKLVIVEVRDYGSGFSGGRYTVTVRDPGSNRETTSNGANSVGEACSLLHWGKLDVKKR